MAEYPTGLTVATFLSRQADTTFVSQCEVIVEHVIEMCKSYTRGRGFELDNSIPGDLRYVITSRAARLVNNPLQVQSDTVDTSSVQDSFSGWFNYGERKILDRYRVRYV